MIRGLFDKAAEFPLGVDEVLAVLVSERRAKAVAVLDRFLVVWEANYGIDNIKKLSGEFRAALRSAGVEKKDLPVLPRKYNDLKRKRDSESIVKKQEAPVVIGSFSVFMSKICRGLRIAIDEKQCPMALFLLSFLVPLRSNDQNEAHERVGGRTCDLGSHRIVSDAKTSDGRSIVGTFVNMFPSKARAGLPHPNYATVYMCDPEYYPLVEEAFAFVHSPSMIGLPCTTYVRDYINKVPSGPQRKHEWSGGILNRMLLDLDLSSSISEWGTLSTATYDDDGTVKSPGGITAGLGRAFNASSVEQGRFYLTPPLTNNKAVERLLGHVAGSTQNAPYLKVCCSDPPKAPGVVMRKVTASDPIYLDDGAIVITEGVCLVAVDPPPAR
jgi:hypothetical protein